jgi:hypothetical protein
MKLTYFTAVLFSAFVNQAIAGVGCDLNLRINNKTPNSVTVLAAQSSASKAGLNLWNPIDGLENAGLEPVSAGAASHSNQAVELEMPCWTGKVDFRIRYLDGTVERWKNRDSVSINSGDTIQINIP